MGGYWRVCLRCGKGFPSDCAEVCYNCSKLERVGVGLRERQAARERGLARVAGFKLKIELVPSLLWYKNVRSIVSPAVWDIIRKEAYRVADYRCQVCGSTGKMFCHEVWLYDDDRHIQKLDGFEALCELCHNAKHIGLAGIKGMTGELDYNSLIRHFKRVNGCSYEEFVLARDVAFEVWEGRSAWEWTQDLGAKFHLVAEAGGLKTEGV